jgi:hypothetical protein
VHLLATVLRPKIDGPGVEGLLPRPGRFEITVIDPALHRVVDPVTQFVAWLFARVRQLQQGAIQIYLLYIFLTVLGLLIWS